MFFISVFVIYKAYIEKCGIAYLKNIIFSILSMYSFNSTDVQTTKYFRTGVNPKLVPVLQKQFFCEYLIMLLFLQV